MNNLNNLFNNIQKNKNQNNARVTKANLQGAVVFGEEERNYDPYWEEMNKMGRSFVRDRFDYVEMLATKITTQFYQGDPKYSKHIKGIYSEMFTSRSKGGLLGFKGMNMKGIVCVILYLIVKNEENKQISLADLVTAANKIESSKVKVTERMLTKYIKVLTPHISYRKNTEDNANDEQEKSTLSHIRRLSIAIKMTPTSRTALNKIYKSLPKELKSESAHNPNTIAKCLVYLFASLGRNTAYTKEIAEILKITEYVKKNALTKYKPFFKP